MKNVNHGISYYDELKVVGSYILIEKINNEEHKIGDIIIPDSKKYANNKIGVGKILEIGKNAKKETNLNINDFVLYDYYSAYDNNGKHILIRYDNIILQLTEEDAFKYLNSNLL